MNGNHYQSQGQKVVPRNLGLGSVISALHNGQLEIEVDV